MTVDLTPVAARYWRMLAPRWQRQPLSGNGAATKGGRWNRPGRATLYVSASHDAAIAEYYQELVKPGVLAAYDITSPSIVDLRSEATRRGLGVDEQLLAAEWKTGFGIDKRDPPTWTLVDRLLDLAVDGALVPSAQMHSGTNLFLWRWSADGGVGATVKLVDPFGDLA